MPRESLITNSIVQRVALDWRGQDPSLSAPTSLQTVTAVLAAFPRLPADTTFVIYGHAHSLLLPHPANPEQGTRWTPDLAGGGKLELVLARVDQPAQQVRVEYHAYADQGRISLYEPKSWLVADFNPTTILTGNNVLPATIADPETGEIDDVPSSSPRFLITASRMGLDLLPQLARQAGLTNGDLFSDRTLWAIKHGDVHVVRGQWAAYLPADVRAFLQLLVVLYDQTIAYKQGIIQLATHLGLTFVRYPPTGPLTGVKLQKYQGNKLQYSVSFYDKAVEVARMRQGRTLTRLEAETVRDHVRLDVTVHSAGVLTLIGEARRRLPRLLQKHPNYLDAKSAQRFLTEEPRPTLWRLERTIGILAHTTTPDCSRESFGAWLIPEMLSEVLRLDCIAGFTTADLDAVSRLGDQVVAAWCQTERVEDDWAGALAQAAQCSKGWVYERRKKLLATRKIDIARPFAFYRDLVFFGPNSLTKPRDRSALNAALARGDAATNLRLRQQAVKDFDRRRIDVVGATVRAPPLLMSPKVALEPKAVAHDQPDLQSVAPREPDVGGVQIVNPALVNRPPVMELKPPHVASPELDHFDDLPADFDDVDGDEAVPIRPAWTRPIAAPALARSNPHEVGRGPMKEPGKVVFKVRRCPPPPSTGRKVTLRGAMPSPPPPPTQKKLVLRGTMPSLPSPPTEKKVVLPAMPSPPPSTGSNVVLRAAYRPLPSPTEKKVLPRATRSTPPPATAVRISTGRSGVASVDATIRRQASEQYFDYRSGLLRALLASKSWTRTGIDNSKGSRRW